jgi:protease-4
MPKRNLAAAIGISLLIVALFAVVVALVGRGKAPTWWGTKKVGVVELSGTIEDPTEVLEALRDFGHDPKIAAVVFRVNSPGGGVAASQEIYREILRLKKKKPVVASLGEVAASGGLYVASPCTKIVANPGTITGSIGVITTLPDLSQLLQKIGIRLQVIKTGRLKATGQIDRPLTPEERAMLQRLSREIYDQFVRDLARARRIPEARVRAFADGRVFSGAQAKELGLVDRLGNYYDAVNLAARLGGIEGRPELVYPGEEEGGWLRRLLEEGAQALARALAAQLAQAPRLQYLYRPGAARP